MKGFRSGDSYLVTDLRVPIVWLVSDQSFGGKLSFADAIGGGGMKAQPRTGQSMIWQCIPYIRQSACMQLGTVACVVVCPLQQCFPLRLSMAAASNISQLL